ncbi:MAG: hypothetical protein LJE66_09085 [Desulfobacterales bacterium]|nr:hypothetical protein [Desulfobacterales bacterium]
MVHIKAGRINSFADLVFRCEEMMRNKTMNVKISGAQGSRDQDAQNLNAPEIKDGGRIGKEALDRILKDQIGAVEYLDTLILNRQASKHEVLNLLSDHYGVAPLEYDEMIQAEPDIIRLLELDQLMEKLWYPISVRGKKAFVAASDPRNPEVAEAARKMLNVSEIQFLVSLPSDIRLMIENSWDVNHNFPPSAGRTPLARLRTWLADQRTMLAQYRTSLAKGRTGLAFIRTGLAFVSIALVLFRVFGLGILNVLEALMLVVGIVMFVDGLIWYLPARKVKKTRVDYIPTEPTFGTTVLEFDYQDGKPTFKRTPPIKSAEALRRRWNCLTPVTRRRFLAIDRTDLAEERTILANYRTIMARARTGLAFTRTGIAFSGLGIALLRQFPASAWRIFDLVLILIGIAITLEGFYWYIPGRKTSKVSAEAIKNIQRKVSIWDFMFRPFHKRLHLDDLPHTLTIKGSHALGIWGTTGLALDRTLIADRRNVKSRLRTVMARSRTGMSFIRTGASFFSIGLGLQVYFGSANLLWTLHNAALILVGVFLIADGFYWHLPAEKIKKAFPYCFADMEIVFPDYATPSPLWKKVIFSHEDL